MRIIKKVLKWIGLSIGLLLLLVVVAGLGLRLISPTSHPPGELVDVGGFNLHINATGERNDKPTLVMEAGAGAPGEHYHWISEGLKNSIRVVRYDRAGIAHSEQGIGPRSPKSVAQELHLALELSGESPPYIMAGHSYGGHYIRIFTDLYPDDVAAMVFLDSSHPDAHKRMNLPSDPWFMTPMYKVGAVVADLGVLHLFEKMTRLLLWAPGLPDEIINDISGYSLNGDYLRGYLKGDGDHEWEVQLKEMASAAIDFEDIPIIVFSGTQQNDKALERIGVDPENFRTQRAEMQEEIANLSSDGELFFMDSGHITMYTLKENADFICEVVIELLEEL